MRNECFERNDGTIGVVLTQGRVAIIDKEDAHLLSGHRWHLQKGYKTWYAVAERWSGGHRKGLLMHRIIVQPKAGQVVDHVNGNGLDNRRLNLRCCQQEENERNRHSVCGSSRFKGVSRHTGRWRAVITTGNKKKHLGYFCSEEKAAEAYDRAALVKHGEFACTNQMCGRR